MSANKSAIKSHFRRFLIPLGVGLPVIILLAAMILLVEPEALSPDEIMAKQEWTDKELQVALAKTMSPAMAALRQEKVMRHLNEQMKKRSPERQAAIRLNAVTGAVTSSLDQVRKMPEKEQRNMVQTIHATAEKQYDELMHNRKRRKEIMDKFQTKEMDAFSKEVNRVIMTELTPEERVQFAPITKIWIRTMQTVGR